MVGFIFGGDTGLSYEQLQRQRALAQQLSASAPRQIDTVGEGIYSAANSIAAGLLNRRANKADEKNREAHGAAWEAKLGQVGGLFGGGAPAVSSSSPAPSYTPPPVDPTDPTQVRFPIGQTGPAPDTPKYPIGEAAPAGNAFVSLLDRTEGAGSYSTLFGHAQRPGGPDGGRFDGVDVTQMTLDQLADFTDPSGEYGQWVKSQVGRVATPMGRGQIVGTTLRNAAKELGLPGDTRFTPTVQNQLIEHLARRRLASASTPEGKRAALRSEWEGFQHVPDAELDQAIASLEGGGAMPTSPAPEGFALAPRQPQPQPGQQQLPPDNMVASLSPQAGGTMTDAAPLGMPAQAPQQPPVRLAQAQPQAPQGAPQGFQLGGSGMGRAFSEMQRAGQPMPGAPQPRPQPQAQPQPSVSTQGQQGPTQAIVMQLMELAASPYASESQKAIAQMLMEQYQQQNDPLRQLQIQQAQRELQQGPERQIRTGPDGVDRYVDTGEPVFPGVQPEQDAPDPTTGQREYQQAVQQGYQGTWMDYQRDLAEARRDQTTINNNMGAEAGQYLYGTDAGLPAGWRLDTRTGEASRIPGGPAAAEQEQAETEAATQEERRQGQNETSTDVITSAAARAREAAQNRDLGAGGTSLVGMLPWTDSAEVLRQVEVLRSNAKIGNLQAMREASPTGGALGAVSDSESAMLAAKAGALDPNSPNFLRDLADYERTLLRTVHGREAGDAIFEATRDDPTGGDTSSSDGSETRNGMTRQEFFSHPGNIAAAEKHGVTLEEMWEAVK